MVRKRVRFTRNVFLKMRAGDEVVREEWLKLDNMQVEQLYPVKPKKERRKRKPSQKQLANGVSDDDENDDEDDEDEAKKKKQKEKDDKSDSVKTEPNGDQVKLEPAEDPSALKPFTPKGLSPVAFCSGLSLRICLPCIFLCCGILSFDQIRTVCECGDGCTSKAELVR